MLEYEVSQLVILDNNGEYHIMIFQIVHRDPPNKTLSLVLGLLFQNTP